jgi:hypothetical protein
MSTRTEVNSEATKDVASRATPSSSQLVQRKCACGGSAGMTGDCEECNDKRLSVQRFAIGGGPSLTSFNNSLVNDAKQLREQAGVQTKLNVSEPGDKYELEADRVADSVMRNSDDAANITGEQDDEDLVQTKLVDGITPLVQRQVNEEEEEEEDDEVQRQAEGLLTLELSEEDKAEQLTGQLSQAKMGGSRLPAGLRQNMEQAFGVDFGQVKIHSDGAANSLSHSLHASAFTTGSHIFFRHGSLDYTSTSGRRLLAHELTHVVQQNPLSRVKPASKGGGFRPAATNAPEAVAAPDVPVQRDVLPEANEELIQRDDEKPVPDAEPDEHYIGYLFFLDRNGDQISSFEVFHVNESPIAVGIHNASVSGSNFGNLKVTSKGQGFSITKITITTEDPNDKLTPLQKFQQARRKSKRTLLVITTQSRRLVDAGGPGADETEKQGELKPSGTKTDKTETTEGTQTEGVEGGDKEKGVEGGVEGGTGQGGEVTGGGGEGDETSEGTGEQTGEQTGEGAEQTEGEGTGEQKPGQAPPTGIPPADEQGEVPSEEPPAEQTPSDGPKGETPDAPEQGESEEGTAKEKTGDLEVSTGVEGGKVGGMGEGTEPGSKYGWLGWIHPSPEVIKALETLFEALGDTEEFAALTELLNHLKEFEKVGDEMRSWFDDSDKFLRVVLGLETSEAIDALERWALNVPKRRRGKFKSAGKGLMAIVKKVLRVLDAIRKILVPVFKTRQAFMSAFGAVTEIFDEIPAFEELLAGEIAKPGTPEFEALLEQVSTGFTSGIQRQLKSARAAFTGKLMELSKADLISSKELARAILRVMKKAMPPHVRAGVTVAEKFGLVDATADHVVAPLIPDSALSAINGLLEQMFSLLNPVFTAAEKILDEIISGAEVVLKEELTPLIKDIFMPQRTFGFSRIAPAGDLGLLNMMRASRGEVMPRSLRREMETSMGFDFGSIRIHHDFAAQRASQMFQANAFTVGSDIFFGPGKFDPDTDIGRHLLAHELTHSVQQGNGSETGVVQRDAKGLSKEIAAKYAEFLKEAKSFRASPKRKAEAADMRTVVEGLIGQPASKALPKLPVAYVVVKKKGGKTIIRRKSAWVFLVPPLRIVNKKLAFGFLYFDPKAAARKQLRASLGCKKKEEAHHIIPLELRDHQVSKLAEKNGFTFNKAKNGVCLPKKIHSGSHPIYTESIRTQLNDLAKQYMVGGKLNWTSDLSTDFDALLVRNRKNLRARGTKLK